MILFLTSRSGAIGKVELASPAERGWSVSLPIPESTKAKLLSKFPYQIVTVSLFGPDKKTTTLTDQKILIGGYGDLKCNSPLLLVDYNGTIDGMDDCTLKEIEKFAVESKGYVAVISTSGAAVKSYIASAFSQTLIDRMVVLDADSAPTYGLHEKASRIEKMIKPMNSCLLGIAGDTPSKEGISAKQTQIPYFFIDSYNARSDQEPEGICLASVQSRLPVSEPTTCPATSRKITHFQAGQLTCSFMGLYYTQPDYGSATCLTLGYFGKTVSHVLPVKRFYCERLSSVRMQAGACPHGFYFKGSNQASNLPDMQEYPEGSYAAKNWCELKDYLDWSVIKKRL